MTVHDPAEAGAVSVVALPDEVDLGNCSDVLESLLTAICRTSPHLVVDASGVTFIDSSGLNALVRARDRAEAMNGSFHLVSAGQRVTRLLEITRLDLTLHLVPTTEDATACVTTVKDGHTCGAR